MPSIRTLLVISAVALVAVAVTYRVEALRKIVIGA